MKYLRISAFLPVLMLVGTLVVPQASYASSCDPIVIVSDASTSIGDAAAIPTQVSQYWTASIPGATWIWDSAAPSDITSDHTVVFTRSFSLDAAPQSATLYVAADDIYNASVNANGVGSLDESQPFMTVGQYDVTDQLAVGTNTLSFTVTNLAFGGAIPSSQNPGGLLYKLVVQPDCGSTSGDQGGSGGSSGSSGQILGGGNSGVSGNIVNGPSAGQGNGGASSGITGGFTNDGTPGGNASTTSGDESGVASTSTTSDAIATSTASSSALAAAAFFANIPFLGWLALFIILIAILLLIMEMIRRRTKNQ